MNRLYIAPIIGDGGIVTPYRPKYMDGTGFGWTIIDYGSAPICILCVKDITPAFHSTLSLNADIYSFPTDFDINLTGQDVTDISDILEVLKVPAGWVNASLTFRQVLRSIGGIFFFSQRYYGNTGGLSIFDGGTTLNTQFDQLPSQKQTDIINAAESLGYNSSGLSGNLTIRNMLKDMSDAWGNREIQICSFII